MKVGDIIQLKRYPQNGKFKVVEVCNRKQGITEIVYHPVNRTDKWAAGWSRYFEVVESCDDATEQAAKEVQDAVEAIKAFVKARPALIIKPESETAAQLRPLQWDLFWALQRLYTLTGVRNATTEARYASRVTVDNICKKG